MGVLVFVVLALTIKGFANASREVACGSTLKLRHENTKYFLKSGPHLLQSSGQNVVTLDKRGDPDTMLWQVSDPQTHSKFLFL